LTRKTLIPAPRRRTGNLFENHPLITQFTFGGVCPATSKERDDDPKSQEHSKFIIENSAAILEPAQRRTWFLRAQCAMSGARALPLTAPFEAG